MRELLTGVGEISDTPFKSIARNLQNFQITGVIDVGANVGQFGLDIRRHGFEGLIVSYEPVHETYLTLSQTIKQHQPWKAFQLGLGAAESERTINISGNAGLSSSILEMKSLHLENFPDSATIAKQKISISTIDKQLEVLELRPQDIMLKLDVQGFEAEVLKGASQSLSKIPLCYLEVSITPLYEGEVSFLPILVELSKFGHEVIDVFRGIKAKDGRLLQLDILTKLSHRA
ncbi:MAG: FkbM family methyltransferase [Actinobacteria bacterium]|nr:FkbM family methyltransferase [Actinomycetota bacterium]